MNPDKTSSQRSLWISGILVALFALVLSSVGVDQATKYFAEKHLKEWAHENDLKQYLGKRIPVLELGQWSTPDQAPKPFLALSFNYVRNQGAAWGILSDWQDQIRVPFFYLITAVAIFMIGTYLRSTPKEHGLARFALALVMSGAIGNLADRVRLGYVIDFIDVRWVLPMPASNWVWRYNFPNFNWADSCITVGISLLIFDMVVLESRRNGSKKTTKTPSTENLA